MGQDVTHFLVGKIEDNQNILLASFGWRGITHSELKSEIVQDILSETVDEYEITLEDSIDLFFKLLRSAYRKDMQFVGIGTKSLDTIIEEEKTFILDCYSLLGE